PHVSREERGELLSWPRRPREDAIRLVLFLPELQPEHFLERFWAVEVDLHALAVRPRLQLALAAERARERRPQARDHHERHVTIRVRCELVERRAALEQQRRPSARQRRDEHGPLIRD